VFEGWHVTLATVTRPLLQFPAVASAYFTFILQLCELYPGHLASLHTTYLQSFVASLDWGMSQLAADSTGQCLQAMQELAEFHMHQRATNRPGFSQAVLPGMCYAGAATQLTVSGCIYSCAHPVLKEELRLWLLTDNVGVNVSLISIA
jgi:hypothetical protein